MKCYIIIAFLLFFLSAYCDPIEEKNELRIIKYHNDATELIENTFNFDNIVDLVQNFNYQFDDLKNYLNNNVKYIIFSIIKRNPTINQNEIDDIQFFIEGNLLKKLSEAEDKKKKALNKRLLNIYERLCEEYRMRENCSVVCIISPCPYCHTLDALLNKQYPKEICESLFINKLKNSN